MIQLFSIFLLFAAVASIEEEGSLDDEKAADVSYLGNSIFKKPSESLVKDLTKWNETAEVNPEELGEYAEGDIVFPSEGRNGLKGENFRWPGGVVPYEIQGGYNKQDLETIEYAMSIYHKYTCIRFKRRNSNDRDYISIVNGPTGCWSSVGRIGGRQEVNLQSPYCTSKVGTPLHELMHALGFLHEQNRYERDDFVQIAWNNIKKGHEQNFNKALRGQSDGYGVKYDYRSVMHYSPTAFSVNGNPTIFAKDSSKTYKMGQREGFSKGDILKLNNMYRCPNSIPNIEPQNHPQSKPAGGGSGGLLSMLFSLQGKR